MSSSPVSPCARIFFGKVIHSKSAQELEIIRAAALGIADDGKILFLDDSVQSGLEASKKYKAERAKVITLTKLQFLFPGMIDTHFHAPQWPNLGVGSEYVLADWRRKLTEKIEGAYSSQEKARFVYNEMVQKVLENGTTCVAYNSTIHVEATNILADMCKKYGQRAILGKYCINVDAPEYNIEPSVEVSLKGSRECISYIRRLDPEARLLHPCLEPRSGGSVDHHLMLSLGELWQDDGRSLHIQSHMCEAQSSLESVLKYYPDTTSQADVFYKRGLLHQRTILAHCIHLSDADVELLRKTRAGVAHCPASNTNLRDGECRVRWLLDHDVKVGLGTDCSAGHSPSILINMREAISTSHHLVIHTKDERQRLKIQDVVFLATLGGAQVCDLDSRVGNFQPGKEFDALLIDLGANDNVDVSSWEHDDHALLSKWVFNGDDRSIRRVFVHGKEVAGKDYTATGPI